MTEAVKIEFTLPITEQSIDLTACLISVGDIVSSHRHPVPVSRLLSWGRMKQENQLTQKQMEAAEKVAADILTDQQIIESVGVSRRTFYRWKHLPAFRALVQALNQAHRKQLMKRFLVDTKDFLWCEK
jgi:hypothetical protein